MEGIVTYESSYEYIKLLNKDLLAEVPLTIHFSKLDTETAGQLRKSIANILSDRSHEIYNTMASNQDQLLH